MGKEADFTIRHIIAKTSKEEKELHMRQALAAMLKIANGESLYNQKKSKP